MSNTLLDLNNSLFSALDKLQKTDQNSKHLNAEIERANASAKIGQCIISNASLQLKAERLYKVGQIGIIPRQLEDHSSDDE